MFCPNCGVTIEDKNQKFCTSCGTEFPSDLSSETPSKTPSEAPQSTTAEVKTTPTYRRQSVPTYQPKPTQTGGPGPESKKCLIFAIASIVLFLIGMGIVGASVFGGFSSYYFPSLNLGITGWIIAIVVHIVGLTFGILSRVFSGRADSEPVNNLERFGSVIAVFGIIINAIPIFIIPVIMVFRFGIFNMFMYF